MEGSFSDGKSPRMFRVIVGLLGATLVVSLAYSQLSYDTYAQASSRTRQLQARQDNFLTVRGKVNAVVEALSDSNLQFANPSLAIDQRVWNLQAAWSDFRDDSVRPFSGARILTPSPSALDAAMDQFALAALRNGMALRRGNAAVQTPSQITSTIEPQMIAMGNEMTKAIETASAQRDSAMFGISMGRAAAYGSFFALASLLMTGLLVSAWRGFKEWMGGTPVTAMSADKLVR
jgi:hypothetical protein